MRTKRHYKQLGGASRNKGTPTKIIVAQNNDRMGKRSKAAKQARERSLRRAQGSGNTGCCGTFRRGGQTRGDKNAIKKAEKYGYVCPTDMSQEERIRAGLPDKIWWGEDGTMYGKNKQVESIPY